MYLLHATVCVWYMYSLCYRPAQHGADLLSLLSDILNTHGGESGAAACGLALEALGHLCQAEVRCPYIKCVSVCQPVCLFFNLSISICLSSYLSTYILTFLPTHLPIYPSTHLLIYPSIHLSICLSLYLEPDIALW